MENMTLDLITVTDPQILRAIRFVGKKPYDAEKVKLNKALEGKEIATFVIANYVFNQDADDAISKLIIEKRQAELYSISFTKGEEYKNKKGDTKQGINFSSFLTKAQHKEDIDFEQDIIISKAKAELSIMKQKAEIKLSLAKIAEMADLEDLA
jgi:hypothetical protein